VSATAAILAGGASTRMGEPKAVIELGGRPLIGYPIGAARAGGLEPIVIAKRGSELPPLDCPVVEEPDEPRHPLCGIVAALRHTAPAGVLIVACDMPFVEDTLLAWLASHRGTVVPERGGLLEPLLARYGGGDLGALEQALERGAPLREAVAALSPRVIREGDLGRFGEPDLLCMNVNSPDELATAEALLVSRAPRP
jgi:molybdopterin-guanine dinucleotide biosynthesis protein A